MRVISCVRFYSISSAQQQLEQQIAQMTENASKIIEQQQQCMQLQDTATQQEASIQQLQSSVVEKATELATQQQQYDSQLAALNEQLTALRQQTDDKLAQMSELQSKYEQLLQQQTAWTAEKLTLQTQIQSLQSEQQQQSVQLSESRTAAEQATAREAEMAGKLQAYEKLVAELQAKRESDELIRRKLHNQVQELKGSIRVFCRLRPANGIAADTTANAEREIAYKQNKDESNGGLTDTLEITGPKQLSVDGRKEKREVNTFNFDRVFTEQAGQESLFEELSSLVTSSLDGYNVSVFAYGQTGSGKTYTMLGPVKNGNMISMEEQTRGCIPRAIEQIFSTIEELKSKQWSYTLKASVIEIYCEEIRDLLAKDSNSPTNKAPKVSMEKSK